MDFKAPQLLLVNRLWFNMIANGDAIVYLPYPTPYMAHSSFSPLTPQHIELTIHINTYIFLSNVT